MSPLTIMKKLPQQIKNLTKEIGLKGFFVKDESYRFGLNAFKVLGASYAIANIIREKIGLYEYKFNFDDIFTKIGMRVLANNISDDKKIISGESGAVTSGIVYSLMTDDSLRNYREKIGLDKDSVVLCISTEGDTDKKSYREIICEEK